MAEAYKVKGEVSLPRAIRPLYDDSVARSGVELYQTEGRSYRVGDYVLAKDITPPLRKRAEEGKLDHLLEPVDLDEANEWLNEQARNARVSTFTPEHATEAHALKLGGHDVVNPPVADAEVVPEEETAEVESKPVPKKQPSRKTKSVSG